MCGLYYWMANKQTMITSTLYFANLNSIRKVYIMTIKLSIDIGNNIF